MELQILGTVMGGVILFILGRITAFIKLPLNKQIETYLESEAGKRQVIAIVKVNCDDRHKDDKDILSVQFASIKKEISAMRKDFTEVNDKLYNLIDGIKDEILEIYKQKKEL